MTKRKIAKSTMVPGDIAVRLSSTSMARTFYDITVVNCLTDDMIGARHAETAFKTKTGEMPQCRLPPEGREA